MHTKREWQSERANGNSAEHIPIEAFVKVCIQKAKSISQWHEIKGCSKADFSAYRKVLDTTLQKISMPFSLQHVNMQRNIQETIIEVNAFCAEITHTLLTTEEAAITVRKIRKGTDITGSQRI